MSYTGNGWWRPLTRWVRSARECQATLHGTNIDAFLQTLIDPKLNSRPRWKLRWAMSTSEKLIALESEHKREVMMRVHALEGKFGKRPPPEMETEIMMVQNEITLACLFSLSTLEDSPNRDKHIELCRKLLLIVYDYSCWGGPEI